MPLLENNALINNPILRRMPVTAREWRSWVHTLNSQSVISLAEITLTDSIHQGQTDYDTGTGFWLGDDGGTTKFSIGNSSGNKLTWNGSTLAITGTIDLTNSAQTFTPSWGGFSTDPTDSLSYLDLGAMAFIWNAEGTSILGTSNATTMTWDSGQIPAAIRPSELRRANILVVDNSVLLEGAVQINGNGSATFEVMDTSTVPNRVAPNSVGFTNSGAQDKGLPGGWIVGYAL